MKILMLNFSGTPAVVYYCSQLSNALSNNNDVVIIIPKYAPFEEFEKSVKVLKFAFPPSLFGAFVKSLDISLYRYLTKKINQIKPDVIHITFELRLPFFFAWLLHQKYPLVTTIHEPKPFPLGLMRKIIINKLQEMNKINLFFKKFTRRSGCV